MQKEVLLNETVCLAMMKPPAPRTKMFKTKDRPCSLPRPLRAFPLLQTRGWYKRFKEMAAKFKNEKKRKKCFILCIQRGWSGGGRRTTRCALFLSSCYNQSVLTSSMKKFSSILFFYNGNFNSGTYPLAYLGLNSTLHMDRLISQRSFKVILTSLYKRLISLHLGKYLNMIIWFSYSQVVLKWTPSELSPVAMQLKTSARGWFPLGSVIFSPAKVSVSLPQMVHPANPPVSNIIHVWSPWWPDCKVKLVWFYQLPLLVQ